MLYPGGEALRTCGSGALCAAQPISVPDTVQRSRRTHARMLPSKSASVAALPSNRLARGESAAVFLVRPNAMSGSVKAFRWGCDVWRRETACGRRRARRQISKGQRRVARPRTVLVLQQAISMLDDASHTSADIAADQVMLDHARDIVLGFVCC
eukprot:1971597-Rhodomonas_salina.1